MRGAVLPMIGVLTIAAAAIGLELGHSAVSQINPIYYRGAAPIARDVMAEAHAPAPLYAQASGWQQGYQAMAHDCGGDCPAAQARHDALPASVATPGYAPPPHLPQLSTAQPAGLEVIDGSADAGAGAQSRMNRYLHYPVSQDQEAIAADVAGQGDTPTQPRHAAGDPEGM
jgi:hypothetical protein